MHGTGGGFGTEGGLVSFTAVPDRVDCCDAAFHGDEIVSVG